MTSYAWPSGWTPQTCTEPVLRPNARVFNSQYSGAFQAVDLLGERFMQRLRLRPAIGAVEAGERAAYFNRLRGAHFVTAHAFTRPQPTGTQRGAPTLSANVAQGATSFPMAGLTNGATWLAGDMFGVGGQLFQVAVSITVSGTTATVTTVNRARAALTSSAAVTWDKPTASWHVANLVEVMREPGLISQAVDLDLIQSW